MLKDVATSLASTRGGRMERRGLVNGVAPFVRTDTAPTKGRVSIGAKVHL